jgi:hypothetical protein
MGLFTKAPRYTLHDVEQLFQSEPFLDIIFLNVPTGTLTNSALRFRLGHADYATLNGWWFLIENHNSTYRYLSTFRTASNVAVLNKLTKTPEFALTVLWECTLHTRLGFNPKFRWQQWPAIQQLCKELSEQDSKLNFFIALYLNKTLVFYNIKVLFANYLKHF